MFWAVWPWHLTDDLEKQQSTSSKQHQAFCIISSSYSNWSYSPETVKMGFDLCDLDLWPLTFCMDVTFVNGNKSWKFHDDAMTVTLWEGVTNGRTDRQTDRRTDRGVLRTGVQFFVQLWYIRYRIPFRLWSLYMYISPWLLSICCMDQWDCILGDLGNKCD